MPRPIIALLTDFGLRDHYVASMKGVILGVVPDATLVDLTHEIAPQDLLSAAYELHACWRDFPRGSIFVVVVDPGVGTSRRAIAAAAGGAFFVAPDNGVLSMVFDEEPPSDVVELSNRRYLRPVISNTFEGRDRFAPAAAWLARGTRIGELGPPVTDWVRLAVPVARAERQAVFGEIVRVDRFGNLISNIGADLVASAARGRTPVARVGGRETVAFVRTYAEAPAGSPCAMVGSSGRVEIAVNGGSAAASLALGTGARLLVAADEAALQEAEKM